MSKESGEVGVTWFPVCGRSFFFFSLLTRYLLACLYIHWNLRALLEDDEEEGRGGVSKVLLRRIYAEPRLSTAGGEEDRMIKKKKNMKSAFFLVHLEKRFFNRLSPTQREANADSVKTMHLSLSFF